MDCSVSPEEVTYWPDSFAMQTESTLPIACPIPECSFVVDFNELGPDVIPQTESSHDSPPLEEVWEPLSIWHLPEGLEPAVNSQFDEDVPEESLKEDNNEFGDREAKRTNLDPLSLSPPFSSISSESYHQRILKLLQQQELEIQKAIKIIPKLIKCDIEHDSDPTTILTNLLDSNSITMEDLPKDDALYWIKRGIKFKQHIYMIRKSYEAIKFLYVQVPYVKLHLSFEEVKRILLKSEDFGHLSYRQIKEAYKGYSILFRCTEIFFNPLIRKSYEEEFYSLVDTEAELAVREFIMGRWRHEFSKNDFLLKIVRALGFCDEEYFYCLKQIQLQERFDKYLCHSSKVMHDSLLIENLIKDKDIVTEEFKSLNPELRQLSLEACIKKHRKVEEVKQCFLHLQLLENAHRRKETCDIDEMLKALYHDFPWMVDFPNDKPVDIDLEQRFKSAICKIKEIWFPGIADHYVVEATLLYMKHFLLKTVEDGLLYLNRYYDQRSSQTLALFAVCHEHRMYNHVLDVVLKLA